MVTEYYRAEVICPKCEHGWAWLGDHGACIELQGCCLTCVDKEISDWDLEQIVRKREEREKECGRRVLPCPFCCLGQELTGPCNRCHGKWYIFGIPPKIYD